MRWVGIGGAVEAVVNLVVEWPGLRWWLLDLGQEAKEGFVELCGVGGVHAVRSTFDDVELTSGNCLG